MSNQNNTFAQSPHAPPLSVVVVRNETTSDGSNVNNNDNMNNSNNVWSSSSSRQRNTPMPAAFTEPFRLQPRKPLFKPFALGGGNRGRKRTAQSISHSADSPAIVSSFGGSTPQSKSDESFSMPFASEAKPSFNAHGVTGSSPRTENGMILSTPQKLPSTPNTALNKTLECLSIHRPPPLSLMSAPQNRPPIVSTTTPSVARARNSATNRQTIQGSSFTAYANASSPSPADSLRSRAGSISSCATRMAGTPASSTCSPRFAPLTVLTKNGQEEAVSSNNNIKTPQRRPPLHHGGFSSMLFSLDSRSRTECNKATADTTEFLVSPRLPPAMVHCRRPSMDETLSTVQDYDNYLPSPADFHHQARVIPSSRQSTVRNNEFLSPSKRSRSGASPRTPLPKVTLTPRSTSSRHSSGLPRFPSPSEVDAAMLISPPFINTRTTTTNNSNIQGVAKKNEEDDDEATLPSPRKLNYNQRKAAPRSLVPEFSMTENSFSPVKKMAAASSAASQKKDTPPTHAAHPNRKSPPKCPTPLRVPKIKTTSLLTPSQTSAGVLQCLLKNDGRSTGGAAGSVSDIDDDEAFVLTAPKVLEEQRRANSQRASQRRRRSSDIFINNSRWSSSSIPSSNHQQAAQFKTGLMGGISTPPETSGRTAPFHQGSSLKRKTEDSSPQMYLATAMASFQKSSPESPCCQQKKGSPDSSKKQNDGERDFTTPPPLLERTLPATPPLTPNKDYDFASNHPAHFSSGKDDRNHNRSSSSNFCISGADSRSVELAIANMVFNAEHKESPRVRAV